MLYDAPYLNREILGLAAIQKVWHLGRRNLYTWLRNAPLHLK